MSKGSRPRNNHSQKFRENYDKVFKKDQTPLVIGRKAYLGEHAEIVRNIIQLNEKDIQNEQDQNRSH